MNRAPTVSKDTSDLAALCLQYAGQRVDPCGHRIALSRDHPATGVPVEEEETRLPPRLPIQDGVHGAPVCRVAARVPQPPASTGLHCRCAADASLLLKTCYFTCLSICCSLCPSSLCPSLPHFAAQVPQPPVSTGVHRGYAVDAFLLLETCRFSNSFSIYLSFCCSIVRCAPVFGVAARLPQAPSLNVEHLHYLVHKQYCFQGQQP